MGASTTGESPSSVAPRGCLAFGQGRIKDMIGIKTKGEGRGNWMMVLLLLHLQLHLQLAPLPPTGVGDVILDVAVNVPGTVAAVDGPPQTSVESNAT